MLGWDILIYPQSLINAEPHVQREADLASWEAGLGGTRWLDELSAKGRAVKLGGNGYPIRYVITAGVLLEVINGGIPRPASPAVVGDDYYLPPNWLGQATIAMDRLRALDPKELLAVEAWDLS